MKDETKLTTQEAISIATYDSRGRILQFAIEMEKMMEIYIAERLIDNQEKLEELIIVILAPRLTLHQKREVFEYFVEKYHPEFKDKYNEEIGMIQGLITDRNAFAHWPVEFSKEAISTYDNNRAITLVKLKNFKEENKELKIKLTKLGDRVEYNQDKTNELISKFNRVNNVLRELINDTAPPAGTKGN